MCVDTFFPFWSCAIHRLPSGVVCAWQCRPGVCFAIPQDTACLHLILYYDDWHYYVFLFFFFLSILITINFLRTCVVPYLANFPPHRSTHIYTYCIYIFIPVTRYWLLLYMTLHLMNSTCSLPRIIYIVSMSSTVLLFCLYACITRLPLWHIYHCISLQYVLWSSLFNRNSALFHSAHDKMVFLHTVHTICHHVTVNATTAIEKRNI